MVSYVQLSLRRIQCQSALYHCTCFFSGCVSLSSNYQSAHQKKEQDSHLRAQPQPQYTVLLQLVVFHEQRHQKGLSFQALHQLQLPQIQEFASSQHRRKVKDAFFAPLSSSPQKLSLLSPDPLLWLFGRARSQPRDQLLHLLLFLELPLQIYPCQDVIISPGLTLIRTHLQHCAQ